LEATLHYLMWIVVQPRVWISCTGETITLKLNICEQYVIHKLWLSFQPSAKLYSWHDFMVEVVALLRCNRGKNHHHACL